MFYGEVGFVPLFLLSMLPQEIENRIGEIRAQVEAFGAELVDIQFRCGPGRSVLTVLADKPGGITLDECARINHELGVYFEFLEGSFLLEVNSPGLDRPLVTERDFLRSLNAKIRVIFRGEMGKTSMLIGKLASVGNEKIELELKDGSSREIGFNQIMKAVREITF